MSRPPRKDPAAVSLGKRGGKAKAAAMTPAERSEEMRKVGQARMASMTPEERSELAAKAVKARAKKRLQAEQA